jgi:DNA-binding LacI/PurR family transcriptional regulator
VVWFVTPTAFEHAVSASTTLMAQLQQALGGRDWLVRHRVMSYGHSENRSGHWDRMADTEAPDAMVVWTGRPAIGEWALARGLRTLFIGGAKENLALPMLAVKSADLVEAAIRELLGRGHRRLCLPLCNRPPTMLKNIRTVVARSLRTIGGSARETTPVSAYEGGPVIEAMVEQALAERAPTGWIFFDWREFLAASCVFRDRGISIPRDVSAVILSWDPAMEWYRPAPAHFRQPLERMAKMAADWVMGEVDLGGTRYFQADWVAGGSLGPA